MRKVAVTGGFASGKSSVCQFFADRGAYVVSADEIVHRLLTPDTQIGKKVVCLLGQDILKNDQFDRAKIAKKVFENKKTLKSLEQILHPAVLEEIENQYNQVKTSNQYSLFIAEVPLLYEIESHHLFDIIIAVVADPSIAKKRVQTSEQEFEMRMTHQLSPEEKSARADYTLINDKDLSHLKRQVDALYIQLTQ